MKHCTFCNKLIWPWQAKIQDKSIPALAWEAHLLCILIPKIENLQESILDKSKVVLYQRHRLNKAFARINTLERIVSSEVQGFTIPREAEELSW